MLQIISTKVAGALSALEELKKRRHAAGNGALQLLKPGECNSFVYNQTGYRIETCADSKALLWLAKIGRIEIRVHRRLYDIAQVIVVKQARRPGVCCSVMQGYEEEAVFSQI